MVLISGIVSVYSNSALMWIFYYLGLSFTTGRLPWAHCDNDWNTKNCIDFANKSVIASDPSLPTNSSIRLLGNVSEVVLNATSDEVARRVTSAEEFWQ